jgi:hypothetical protein
VKHGRSERKPRKKESSERANRAMRREQTAFDENEWSFHKIPPEEQRAAWRWEAERSLGSSTEPWLKLDRSTKRMLVNACAGPAPLLQELSLDHVMPEFLSRFRAIYHDPKPSFPSQLGQKLHLISINWSGSRTKIRRELDEWVAKHWAAVPSEARQSDKGGRKNQFHTWLVDLAIYRAGEAGLTRSHSIGVLAPLFGNITPNKHNKISPSHWEDAQHRTQDRLLKHRLILDDRAKKLSEWERKQGKIAKMRAFTDYFIANLLTINS